MKNKKLKRIKTRIQSLLDQANILAEDEEFSEDPNIAPATYIASGLAYALERCYEIID